MRVTLINGKSGRILERRTTDTDFYQCNYKSFGDDENIDTVITITLEEAVNSLIKAGYTIKSIEE
jgi:hypothetical protein